MNPLLLLAGAVIGGALFKLRRIGIAPVSGNDPPFTIWVSYREPAGDYKLPITMAADVRAFDLMLVVQQLATCVLLSTPPGVPTRAFKLEVLHGDHVVARYERDPSRLATSFWVRTEGIDLGELNTARPPCVSPFCTGDRQRLSSGSRRCA